MNSCVKKGFSFGLTSGIITTLGLIVGLHSGTNSELAVIGGILTIAFADAFSDAFGVHISEESENVHTTKEIWQATGSTFIFKFIFACTFLVPMLSLPLGTAVIASIIWGVSLVAVFSYFLARSEKQKPSRVIAEHVLISLFVVFITHFIGEAIHAIFNS